MRARASEPASDLPSSPPHAASRCCGEVALGASLSVGRIPSPLTHEPLMRVTTRLFASVLAFAGCMSITAFGCGSSQTSEEDAKKEEARVKAKDYYISKVHPIAASCVSCHGGSGKGPTFMADDATASYGTLERTVGLIAEPARSPLVQ